MGRTLPEGIVAATTALAEELAAWCAEGRDRTLAEHETAVLERVRTVLGRLLGAVVTAATTDLDPRLQRARQACPTCRRKVKPHQGRARQVQTRCGTLGLERPWYHCGRCGRGWSAVDATLGVAPRARVSAGLAGWAARLGAATDFREAAELLGELTGLALGAETVRRHAEAAGAVLEAAERAAAAHVERRREPAEAVDPVAGVPLVATDGCMVRYVDGWHEVKLGLVAGWDGAALDRPSYVAARAGVDAFGPQLIAEAARRGLLEVERWEGGLTGRGLAVLPAPIVLGDGAAWIWGLADEHLGARVEVVDCYHAAAHLAAAAKALLGDAPAALTWLEARRAELLAHGPGPTRAALRAARAPTPAAAEVLRLERGYFAKNAERMAYPTFRLDGLPLGSGCIESAADHLVQRRLKRAGMRWSHPGGNAILALRARLRSGRPLTAVLPAHAA